MKRNFIYSIIFCLSVLSSGLVFGQVPAAPTNLIVQRVAGSSTSLDLSWQDNSANETGFDISISLSPSGPFSFKTSVNANVTSTRITGLSAGNTYSFVVSAYNASGGSPYTNVYTQSTNIDVPNPVTGVSFLNVTQTSALIAWTDNTSGLNNEQGFQILRSSGGGFIPLITVGSNVTTYQDNTLLPDNIYQYRIVPYNGAGFNLLNPGTSGIFYTLPSTPSGLVATLSGLTTVNLSWFDNSVTETSTTVERSSDDGKTWSWIGSTPKDISFLTDNNAQEGIRYLYRVRFRNAQGEGPNSNIVAITTKKKVEPAAIYALSAKTVSTTQIDLAWGLPLEDVTNVRVAIEIWRYTENNAFAEQIAVIEPHYFSYSDKTCKPKTKYIYVVHATNYQGKSAPSNAATATTLGPPFAPTNLVVEPKTDAIGTNVLGVSWKDNSDDEWGFTVERSTDKDFAKNVFVADVVENTQSLTSTPIEEGITYHFRVKASNKYGDSKYSDVVTITTAVTAAPNAPYALKGTAKAEEVTLMWGDDSNKEETFEVERSTDGTTFAKVGTTARNVVTYVDNTAKEKTKYSYRVKAVNSKGSSAFSNVLEITTPAKAASIAAPSIVSISSTDEWNVYPNPTADFVNISVNKSEKGTITVLDKLNREVSKIILNENQEYYNVDLSNLPEGTYTINVRTETSSKSKKVYKF